MAKQHFYSCVPAKMSLFNKMDGYDTFAYSEGISREQIEKDLAVIYDNKPAKEDAVLIRDGALPTAFCQYTGQDGTVIQSAVSFIKSDYTGERSAYMVHSLLLSEKEVKEHLETLDGAALNPDVFEKDLSAFDLTSPDSNPITDYPEKDIPVAQSVSLKEIADNYDTGTVKRIIFSLISIVCGKTKTLYLGLPSSVETFSLDCLNFINGILKIFPYHMRKMMSFVTYAGDTSKYQGIKIRCVSEDIQAVPTSKGITIKVGIKEFTGVTDEIIAANATLVDFFYSLLSDDKKRNDFIEFCRYATEKNPLLAKANIKTLSDLVFLFSCVSGYYDENTVLPDDNAVYDFFAAYDKNRTFIKDEYRARSMNCLWRYPKTHTVIPKNVFNKLSNMYKDEIVATKSVIMDVVLELIHTDVMRDKLFGFIKQNYDGENAELKNTVMQNICRVYYGGFLQEQILAFFKEHFESEPQEIRSLILEKLFLTIRTPKVQNMVIGFVDEFYDLLSQEEKSKFYEIVSEMLPEGDSLSRFLADVIDAHIEEERKPQIEKLIVDSVNADEKKQNPQLCKSLCTKCGYVEGVLAQRIFGEWQNDTATDEFIDCMCKKRLPDVVNTAVEIWSVCGKISEPDSEKILSALGDTYSQKVRYDLFEIIDSIDKTEEIKTVSAESAGFADALKKIIAEKVLAPAIAGVFDKKRYPDGIEKLFELAKEREYLSGLDEYNSVREYIYTIDALKNGKALDMFCHSYKIEGSYARKAAAVCFNDELKLLDNNGETDEMFFLKRVVADSLKSEEIKLFDAISAMKEKYAEKAREENPKLKPESVSEKAEDSTFSAVVLGVMKLYESDIPGVVKEQIVSKGGEFENYLISYVQQNKKKAKKLFSDNSEIVSATLEYRELLENTLNVKSQNKGLFGKIFGK